jgi:RHS repeat-associated protein
MELRREPDSYTILHWHHGDDAIHRFRFAERSASTKPLLSLENLAGHRVVVEYHDNGAPARIRQELEQRTVVLAYNDRDLIEELRVVTRDGEGRTLVRYRYDARDRLVVAESPGGATVHYAYDSQDRLVAETNPLGSTFRFRYDERGRCVWASSEDRFLERRLQYHDQQRMTRVVDSLGHETTYWLNALGQVVQERTAQGSVTTNEYDAWGRLLQVTHPDGSQAAYAYDEQGNRTTIVDPCGGTVRIRYNELHLPTETVDARGAKWMFSYDRNGNLHSMTNPLGHRWLYERDGRGLVVAVSTPGGRIIRHAYGEAVQWQEAWDEIALIERLECDGFGNPTAIYDSRGLVQRARYGEQNLPLEVAAEDGRTVQFRWNALGELLEMTRAGTAVESCVYDHFGRLVAHRAGGAAPMLLEYDTEDRLTAVTNRVGERMTWCYDSDGRVVEESHFDGRRERWEYNARGFCTRRIRPDGRAITFTYNACGDLLSRTASEGWREEFAYDENGTLVRATGAAGTLQLAVDSLGRIEAETLDGRRVAFEYDAENNPVVRRVYGPAAHELHMAYDSRRRLIRFRDASGMEQELQWDNANQLTGRTVSHGLQEAWTYDLAGRVCKQVVTTRTAAIAVSREYAYDGDDRVTETRDARWGVAQYGYDRLGRLASVRRDRGPAEDYRYDDNGSITDAHDGIRELAPGGRIIAEGRRRYQYDPNGNVAVIDEDGARTELSYDVDGRLTQVVLPGGAVVAYAYDPLGRRIRKDAGGTRTDFLWAGSQPVAEFAGDQPTRVFFALDREPLAGWDGPQCHIPIVDRTGAVREVLAPDGTRRWECLLGAFGRVVAESGDRPSPFRFRGQYHDRDTGLYYNFARYYSPNLCGYVTPDPIGVVGGANAYLYPRNPLSWDDPLGLRCSAHKGRRGETKMDRYYRRQGYRKIDSRGKAQGIDGVYEAMDPNQRPRYIIGEAKAGPHADLGRTSDGARQMSDAWIDARINGRGEDRLTEAVGHHTANEIRTAALADPANVDKQVFRAPDGSPGSASSVGSYDPFSGRTDL